MATSILWRDGACYARGEPQARAWAALRAEERVYRRTGGGLSPWERRDLQRDLDRSNRHIYQQKHDGQSR